MKARYKFDEGSEGGEEVTSITFNDDEIVDLIDALDEIGVVTKQKGNPQPILGELLRRLEQLQKESENEEPEEETCSECGQEIEKDF